MTRIEDDETLLAKVTQAAEHAGQQLLARFRTIPAPTTLPDLLAGIDANDAVVEAGLRPQVIDLEGIETARGPEAVMLLVADVIKATGFKPFAVSPVR